MSRKTWLLLVFFLVGCVSQSGALASPAVDAISPKGYITFAINVHDWRNVDESADTLLRLIDLFEKYGVRGDFYLTGPMTEYYVEQRPDLVSRLRQSSMTISYHVRPPHPLYTNFDERLRGLNDEEVKQLLAAYELYRLDLATGDLDRSQPGGYQLVANTFGRLPVCAPSPNDDMRITRISQQVYYELGARMTLIYHESGTKIETPFEYVQGLLVRPSDFSITRWQKLGGSDTELFWWNMLDTEFAEEFDPARYLQQRLAAWDAARPPYITVLIHENNFYRQGGTPWDLVYFSDTKKSTVLQPPYDLTAPDASQPRSVENQAQIWAAYEDLLSYAAQNLLVVTSEDLVRMAGSK